MHKEKIKIYLNSIIQKTNLNLNKRLICWKYPFFKAR